MLTADLCMFGTFVIMKCAKELIFQGAAREFPMGRGKDKPHVCCF